MRDNPVMDPDCEVSQPSVVQRVVFGDSIADKFAAAVASSQLLPETTSSKERVQMYGLYKQATEGNAPMEGPPPDQRVTHAKWCAWSANRGLSQAEAMQQYVALVARKPLSDSVTSAALTASPSHDAFAKRRSFFTMLKMKWYGMPGGMPADEAPAPEPLAGAKVDESEPATPSFVDNVGNWTKDTSANVSAGVQSASTNVGQSVRSASDWLFADVLRCGRRDEEGNKDYLKMLEEGDEPASKGAKAWYKRRLVLPGTPCERALAAALLLVLLLLPFRMHADGFF